MSNKAYSKEIANAVEQFLIEDDWRYSFEEDKGFFKFGLNLPGKIKSIRYIVDVKEDELIVYAVSPIGADSDDKNMIATMAEFMCRANYGLKNGCFELDVRDGEVRFRSYVDCEEVLPSQAVIRNSIYCSAQMFKRYSAGIVGIIFGDMSAKDAVELCEGS